SKWFPQQSTQVSHPGNNVTLPCYVKTTGNTGLTGRWEKNGKPLCVKNFDSDGCSGTPADRLTVSTDWFTNGDLSLTIEGTQPEDSGDYFCYTQDRRGKQSGNPAAVRLTVTEKKSHQMITSSTANYHIRKCIPMRLICLFVVLKPLAGFKVYRDTKESRGMSFSFLVRDKVQVKSHRSYAFHLI
uniref:Ig-like domain-containing protein n=1 Tax=Poecilia reticulata TaxID=8081 RepID=A0A3P9NJB2_POERE